MPNSEPQPRLQIPDFRDHLSHRLSDLCLHYISGQFLVAISYRGGPFSETDDLHAIFITFREISDYLPLLGETLY